MPLSRVRLLVCIFGAVLAHQTGISWLFHLAAGVAFVNLFSMQLSCGAGAACSADVEGAGSLRKYSLWINYVSTGLGALAALAASLINAGILA